MARAVSEQGSTTSHGTPSPSDAYDGMSSTTRELGELDISSSGQGRNDAQVQRAMRALEGLNISERGARDSPAQAALSQSMQQLTVSYEDETSGDSSDVSSHESDESRVHQEYVHFYHHERGVSRPTLSFEEVATLGEGSQFTVEQGWHRFTYPQGLKIKEEPNFTIALQSLLCKKYLQGLPRVQHTSVKGRKFVDVYRQACTLRPGVTLDEIHVEVKVGKGAATRVKEVVVYSHEYNAGIGAQYARIEVRGFEPDLSKDPTTEADTIVECLNERLRQARVFDAWIDMTVDSQSSESIWNGAVVCLVALYSDEEMTRFAKQSKKILQKQHGYLAVEDQQLKLIYPHSKWWCIYCKASTPIERYHSIRHCPAAKCLNCNGPRHSILRCPDRR